MKSNVLKKRIMQNEYVFSVATKFISILLGFIQSILVARYLGAELKGVNAYIASIVSIGSIIVTFGMHQAYPYYRKKYGKDNIYNDFNSLIVIIFLTYFLIGISLSLLLDIKIQLKAVLILIPVSGYARVVAYIALVEMPNKRNSYWTLVTALDIVYLGILMLTIQRNIIIAISILFFSDIVKSIIFTVILKFKLRFAKSELSLFKELIRFGMFPMIALLMTSLNYRIDVIMLHRYSFISDSMIGVYSLGLSLSDKIFLIPDTLKGVLISKLTKGADEHEVAKVSRLGLWIAVVISILLALFGRVIINLLYGVEYRSAYSIIIITAIGTISIVYFKMIGQYNIIKGKQKLNVVMLSIAIVVDVVLNLIMIPLWKINGAAIATTIGNIVCCIVFLLYFCKTTKVSFTEMIIPQKNDLAIIKKLIHR